MLWGLTALLALQLAGDSGVRFFHWPVPGPVMGLVFKWEKKVRVEKELFEVATTRLIDEAGLQRVVVLPQLESSSHPLS